MIPLRIQVVNFGAIPYSDIDLQNVTLAAIVGPNGAGKSTLFTIAPLFALFGTTKNGVSADDMVRKGAQEMAVTFEFEHGGEIYRTTRTRSTKGKGKTTLELQMLVGTDWVSETGTTIRETEEKIRELLNLDAETFTASSMILQGKANEFTAKPPGQRKGILQQILGLEIYDRLLEKVREKERAASVELEAAKRKLSELKEKLKAKPGLESELAQVGTELQSVATEIGQMEAQLKVAEEEVRKLEAQAEKAEELRRQITDLRDEISTKQSEKQKHQQELDWANARLEREAEILDKASEYEQVKEQVTVLQAKKPRLTELGSEENQLFQDINRLDGQIRRLVPQIRELENLLSDREALQQAVTEYQEANLALEYQDKIADEWLRLNDAALDLERKSSSWDNQTTSDIGRLESSIEAKRGQVSTLEQVSCKGTEMSETCPLLAGAHRAAKEIETATNEIVQLVKAVNPYTEEWQNLLEQRNSLGYDLQEHRRLKELTASLRPKAEMASQLEAKAETLKSLKESKAEAEEQRAQLNERLVLTRETATELANKLEPLAAMEARLPKLKQWVELKDILPEARAKKQGAIDRITAIEQEIATKKNQVREWELELYAASGQDQALGYARLTVSNKSGEIKSLQEKQNLLFVKQGGLQSKFDALDQAETERQQVSAEFEPLAKTLTRWQTLSKAFGRDGIPALIIENAVPELERISNEILGQMSRGEHSLRFETQRDLKSKAGVAETLDIIVSDWAGDRPYETFSGGEQLRIDFAIRFALAELLARRAGAKIEWLTVDEGLGSQDAEHRGLVLEAIKAVADRFRKTLVITHIEEAQAVFEQRIYFEPHDEGVEIKVA